MVFDTRLRLFVLLAACFVTSLVVGDIIGGKLLEIRPFGLPFVISVGMIPFPITFLLTDLLNEFYGKRAARFVTIVGLAMALFAFGVIALAVAMPWAPFTREAGWGGINQPSFENVFAGSQRILLASMVAYVVGQFLDIGVFHLLKRITKNRLLWVRATGSTVVSQLVDTIVIQWVAWVGVLPSGKIAELALSSYIVKLAVALALTPFLYAGHAVLERALGLRPVLLDEQGEPIPEGAPAPVRVAAE